MIENFKGKQNSNGFNKNPENINTTGLNKGSRWRKTLLNDLMTLNLNQTEQEQLSKLRAKFPTFFNGEQEQDLQLFMEVKQISLIFHENPTISQKAIIEVKDRIEGKAKQVIEQTEVKQIGSLAIAKAIANAQSE